MIKKETKRKKKIIVYTAGTWDLFHIGHLNIIRRSKKLGDKFIVGVSTDKLVASYKVNPPIISYKDRVEVMKSCKYVDKVVKQEKLLDPKQMQKLKVDILTIADEWKNKHCEGLEWAKKNPKIKVVFLPYTKRVSSSIIKDRVRRL